MYHTYNNAIEWNVWNGIWVALSNYNTVQIVSSNLLKKILDWFIKSSKWKSKHFIHAQFEIFSVLNPKLNLNKERNGLVYIRHLSFFLSQKMWFRLKMARWRFCVMQILSIFFFSFKTRRKKYFLDFQRKNLIVKKFNIVIFRQI